LLLTKLAGSTVLPGIFGALICTVFASVSGLKALSCQVIVYTIAAFPSSYRAKLGPQSPFATVSAGNTLFFFISEISSATLRKFSLSTFQSSVNSENFSSAPAYWQNSSLKKKWAGFPAFEPIAKGTMPFSLNTLDTSSSSS